MTLAAHLRSEISVLATLHADIFLTVQHEAFLSVDVDNKPSYAPAVPREGVLERGGLIVRWRTGTEVVRGDQLTFLGNVPVGEQDRITLPDGTKPPIIEVRSHPDPSGGVFFSQMIFGRPERGMSVTS